MTTKNDDNFVFQGNILEVEANRIANKMWGQVMYSMTSNDHTDKPNLGFEPGQSGRQVIYESLCKMALPPDGTEKALDVIDGAFIFKGIHGCGGKPIPEVVEFMTWVRGLLEIKNEIRDNPRPDGR